MSESSDLSRARHRREEQPITDASALERSVLATLTAAYFELVFQTLCDYQWQPRPRIEDLADAATSVADILVAPMLSEQWPIPRHDVLAERDAEIERLRASELLTEAMAVRINNLDELLAKIDLRLHEAQKDRDHWKANHDEVVRKYRSLQARYDASLGVEPQEES